MPTIFTRIISGELPAYKVAETDEHLAFLDINPVAWGHVLCVPKKEVDYLFNLPEADYLALQAFTRQVAKALEKSVTCLRVGVCVIGLEVPHAHIHLVPLTKMADISFEKPKLTFPADRMDELAAQIASNFEEK